ncbi:hypothetical protein HBE96_16380 [Clostridium sp. P21]|uniref:DUF3784 domain-containing protein n=1 Tax=Clostridium muellerianum TaxID=2716538 RepID=A0A7Y0EIQ3_9CLOT|nr:hypothetical protein [Clostridium muellerianum]NMM64204.1 hypothetical protein [Clostridium muellerianum]
MDATAMTSLMTLLAFMGIAQGLSMKYSKAVRKKLMLDAEGIDKKYVNMKINYLIIVGSFLLVTQVISYFRPDLGEKINILLSAFLLLSITIDMIYRKIRRKKMLKKN